FDRQNLATAYSEIGFGACEFLAVSSDENNLPVLLADVSRQHESQPARATTNQDDFVAQCISRRAKGATRGPRADQKSTCSGDKPSVHCMVLQSDTKYSQQTAVNQATP